MLSFNGFMKKVDEEINSHCGLSYQDLADYDFYSAWEDEADPTDVAMEMLADEGYSF